MEVLTGLEDRREVLFPLGDLHRARSKAVSEVGWLETWSYYIIPSKTQEPLRKYRGEKTLIRQTHNVVSLELVFHCLRWLSLHGTALLLRKSKLSLSISHFLCGFGTPQKKEPVSVYFLANPMAWLSQTPLHSRKYHISTQQAKGCSKLRSDKSSSQDAPHGKAPAFRSLAGQPNERVVLGTCLAFWCL